MRLTIERIRTMVLAAGILLVVALGVFLVVGRWRMPFNRRDLPKRLGVDIQEEANGVTYTQAHAGHTLFKIHASRVTELRNNQARLHDVQIELYGADGGNVDRIAGSDFDYDQEMGTATALGHVEITIMRPGKTPALTAKSSATPKPAAPGSLVGASAAKSEIHVETSGVVFHQKTGLLTTTQPVNFSTREASGSAIGATYNSQQGFLVLDRAVELTTQQSNSPVRIHAAHAEFERDAQICRLRAATADYRGGQASAAQAKILFRDDGTMARLDAAGGLAITTATGGHLAAPTGSVEFNAKNKPHHGDLEGGVILRSVSDGRTTEGSAPSAALEFNAQGELRHAHLQRDVEMQSEFEAPSASGGQTPPVRVMRTWRSLVADIDFRDVGQGKVEPATIRGSGGVVVTSQTVRSGASPAPTRLVADEVTGEFGPASALSAVSGTGHAGIEDTTPTGDRQSATGDRLQAYFAPRLASPGAPAGSAPPAANPRAGSAGEPERAATTPAEPGEVQSAVLEGHVVLIRQPAAKPGAEPQPLLCASAGRAVYQSAGQWLRLTVNPRVEDGGMDLTAERVEVSRQSGAAFAYGNVKATWMGEAPGAPNARTGNTGGPAIVLGGKGPAHVIAAESQFNQASGEAAFRGHARLWQQANSVSAPLIVIDRQKQTLVARSSNPAEPVRAVLVSATATPGEGSSRERPGPGAAGASSPSSVIRVSGGDLWYSGVEHRAVMRAGSLPNVIADSGGVQSVSTQVELFLQSGSPPQTAAGAAPSQVERMTASGDVVLTSQGRRGTGDELAYVSRTGDYVLTGTPSAPPRMTDPQRGSVTGAALIFHSRDDSVSIEGRGQQTTSRTTAPK